MAKRRKSETRARLQKSVRSTLQEAAKRLQHGELKAAHTVASEVFLRAKQAADKETARQLLVESSFRLALKTQNSLEKLDLIEAALTVSPNEARLRFQRGIACLQQGMATEALLEFDAVSKSEPDREGLVFFQRLALSMTGKSSKKAAGLSAAEKNTLALLDRFQQKPAKKAAETPLAKMLVGQDSRLWELLLKMRHDRTFAPIESWATLADAAPEGTARAIAHYYQGVAAMRDAQNAPAFAHWRNALKLGFGPRWCQKNIALSCRGELLTFLEKHRWRDVVNTVRHLPKGIDDESLNQLHSLALFHLGYQQAEKKKWAQAVKDWQEAAKVSNNRYLAQNLALALEKQEHWGPAADAWKDMLRRKPRKTDHPDYLNEKQVAMTWEHISDCYYNAFQEYDALDCLQKAVENDPDNLKRRFKLVSAYNVLGIKDPAMRELQSIVKLDPENLDALTQLAQCYTKDRRHDALPVWKKILELEPENSEARHALARSYLDKAFPPSHAGWFKPKTPSYKKQLAMLQEALTLLPNHPDILLGFAWAHMDARKNTLARDAFWKTYQADPKNPQIAASVMQDLIHLQETALIEKMIPDIQQNPVLLPAFWIDQGLDALDHPGWPERFFEAALGQVAFSNKGTGVSRTSVLVDICMLLQDKQETEALQEHYMKVIRQESPKSGALEYIKAFTDFENNHDKAKARRLLRKAKKMADAAGETLLSQHIQDGERFMSGSQTGGRLESMFGPGMPPVPKEMQGVMEEVEEMMAEVERTQGSQALEELMKRMMEDFDAFGGMDDGEFF